MSNIRNFTSYLQPNREDERARIEAAGGRVIHWKGYRVLGVLAMSRSIGTCLLHGWFSSCYYSILFGVKGLKFIDHMNQT